MHEAEPPPLYRLPQLARRIGISADYARTLKRRSGKLPPRDLLDADGEPLWRQETIDRWACSPDAPTGAAPGEDALWLFDTPESTEPAPISHWGLTRTDRGRMFAVRYDTPHGPLVYGCTPDDAAPELAKARPDHKARLLAHLISPASRPDALIALAEAPPDHEGEPALHLFSLETDGPTGDDRARTGRSPAPLPRLRATAVTPADIARATNRPLPVWAHGTCLPDLIAAARGREGEPLPVPEAAPEWKAALHRITAAVDDGMAARHPTAFALLAADVRRELRTAHNRLRTRPSTGEGWYLAVRPVPPAIPLGVEAHLPAETPATDPEKARAELAELAERESGMKPGDPLGDACEHAIVLLAGALAESPARPEPVEDLHVPGEAADMWLDSLERLDTDRVLATRRGRRLVEGLTTRPSWVGSDGDGLLTAFFHTAGSGFYRTEWPRSLDAARSWGPGTVIVSDDRDSGLVFAFTEGRLVRVPKATGEAVFRYGRRSGSSEELYTALVRAATGKQPPGPLEESRLWQAIISTDGPFRSPWTDVREWAAEDLQQAEKTEAAEAEPG
ncbi:hypothetical protein J0910_30870 [Nocardiopsis sp. CNT-189]|uniref:hypothetical protein n=1 Tax=Nocardiopsis oceanisediminis TaxID=2816862 RepID=UPI003B2D8103